MVASAKAQRLEEPGLEARRTDRPAPRRGDIIGGIQSLQATAGNGAVARVLSQASTVQRQSLDQATLAAGLRYHPDDQRKLVGDGRLAQVYAGRTEVTGDRLAALVKAAEMNAIMGTRIAPLLTSSGWTGRTWKRRNEKSSYLDPFHFWASVFYSAAPGAPARGPGSYNQLVVGYQHAASYTGYVEAIYDSSNPAASDYESMYEDGEPVALGRPVGPKGAEERKPSYSNVHDTQTRDRGTKVVDQISSGGHQGLDAYTKIAGEGARWRCIRAHAASLSNESRFFVFDTPERTTAHGVNFITLWKSWVRVFDKKYNIDDATVAHQIRAGSFDGDVERFAPVRGRDYLLAQEPTHPGAVKSDRPAST